MGINTIITGSTGMVGKGVLLECLESEHIDLVLVINRKSIGVEHPKLKEIVHKDFYNLNLIKHELKGYSSCFFCLGISSVGMKEDDYNHITFDITKHFADVLKEQSPNAVFNYVSGTGER